jgi:hypothetical protein
MEKEPQQIQIGVDPNSYTITNANIVFDEELFHFLLTSANQGRQFTATPRHAKRISLLLAQQIEAYENKFGEIKTQLPARPQNPGESGEETKVGF